MLLPTTEVVRTTEEELLRRAAARRYASRAVERRFTRRPKR
jgi:hypothetical protein